VVLCMREQESGLNDNCVCSVIVFAAYVANERKNLMDMSGVESGTIYIVCIKEVCPYNSIRVENLLGVRTASSSSTSAYNIIRPVRQLSSVAVALFRRQRYTYVEILAKVIFFNTREVFSEKKKRFNLF